MGAKLFHVDGQMDMTKLVVSFRNFANAPKNKTMYACKQKVQKLQYKTSQYKYLHITSHELQRILGLTSKHVALWFKLK